MSVVIAREMPVGEGNPSYKKTRCRLWRLHNLEFIGSREIVNQCGQGLWNFDPDKSEMLA